MDSRGLSTSLTGKRIEPALLNLWGGWPTTLWLRHSSTHLSEPTRLRYHSFLAASVPGLSIPTAIEEAADLDGADASYASAVEWLKERCRENSPLIDKENASYGFRRNMLGLKGFGLAVSAGSILFEVVFIWARGVAEKADWYARFPAAVAAVRPSEIGAILFAFGILGIWIFLVDRDWVRGAADAYAKVLLSSCDRST
jgi:hypothetical protein